MPDAAPRQGTGPLRVAVIGGHGLVGSHVVARLGAEGHRLIGFGRDVAAAARRHPTVAWHGLDLATARVEDWAEALAGVDAVVNCAGALQDSSVDGLHAAHVEGFGRLLEGARAAGVQRVVQISAAGVDSSPGAFGTTKRAAEALLTASGLEWVVLRPGLVLAPTAFGGSALLRGLAAFPFAVPCVQGTARLQCVGADDLGAVVAAALRPGAPSRIVVDVVAAEAVMLAGLLRHLRGWLGLPPASVVEVPSAVATLAARLADGLAWLGWRSPMRSTTLAQLAAGVRGDGSASQRLLGVPIRGLEAWLAAHPAGVQEAWFARLYLLKSVILGALALFWIASGVIGLTQVERAAAVLEAGGFSTAAARFAVVAGSVLDIALGLAAMHRRSVAAALGGMILVTVGYLAAASLWRPDLWLDPLGPLVKSLPAALLAATALATLDDR